MGDQEHDVIDRIDEAMREREITQKALAEGSGLSVTQMNRVMTRQRKLTATELAIIAETLGVSASSLLGEADRRLGMAARVGGARRKAELEGPFRRAEQLLGLREVLDRVMTRSAVPPAPRLDIPRTGLHKDQGAALALTVRGNLGLGNAPITDLEAVAATFGLDVSTQPLPDNLHGLLVADGSPTSGAVALLKAQDTLGSRRFTLAHELGHLLFGDADLAIADYVKDAVGQDVRWTPAKLVELRADCFAKHLLAPDDAVLDIAGELGPVGGDKVAWGTDLVVELAVCMGLSFLMASFRANDVGLLTDLERRAVEDVGAHNAFIGAGRGNDRAVLDAATGVEPPSAMLAQALTAYQQDILGLRPLATLFDVSSDADLASLREQLADWAPAAS